ncbi:MAG: hypothetical protein EXR52_06815 [Dehalococcoidia bacterium]|nr:hypothetical protein [Dehalococcoidia bacterium]
MRCSRHESRPVAVPYFRGKRDWLRLLARVRGKGPGAPMVRLFGRKGPVAEPASADGQWTLDLHIQRDGKFAKVNLAGTRSEAEGLMYDLTAACGSAGPSFGVAF